MLRRVILAGNSASPGADPYWSSVSALLHFDGTDGSTTFTDETGKVWMASGNAQIDTSQSKFGDASGLFDGNGDYISTPSHMGFGFGAGDYTVEVWVRPTAGGADQVIFDNRGGGNAGLAMYSSITAGSSGGKWGFANNTAVAATGSVLTVGAWAHLAVCREGTTVRGYKDGVQEFTFTDSRTYAASAPATIGSNYLGTQPLNARLDDLRITKGIARYTSNFTPPAAPFPAG